MDLRYHHDLVKYVYTKVPNRSGVPGQIIPATMSFNASDMFRGSYDLHQWRDNHRLAIRRSDLGEIHVPLRLRTTHTAGRGRGQRRYQRVEFIRPDFAVVSQAYDATCEQLALIKLPQTAGSKLHTALQLRRDELLLAVIRLAVRELVAVEEEELHRQRTATDDAATLAALTAPAYADSVSAVLHHGDAALELLRQQFE